MSPSASELRAEELEGLQARRAIVQRAETPDPSTRVSIDRERIEFGIVIDPDCLLFINVRIVGNQNLVLRRFRPGVDDDEVAAWVTINFVCDSHMKGVPRPTVDWDTW